MYTTYRLQADELNEQFVATIKQTYKHRNIEIIVQEVEDETDYLLRTEANKEHLMRSIDEAERRENLVDVRLDSL